MVSKKFGARAAVRQTLYLASTLISGVCLSAGASALADEPPVYRFDIAALPLSESLHQFSDSAHQQIIFSEAVVHGFKAPALHGSYTSDEALKVLLTGTNLAVDRAKSGTIMVNKVNAKVRDARAVPGASPEEGSSANPTQTAAAEQTTSPTASRTDEPSSEMGQIIVTARKRQETLLDVPIVVTPISREQLNRRQTEDLKDVAKLVPGLILGQTASGTGTQVSLRGVGTSAQNPGIDASVALNVDGMQITQGAAYGSAVFDLAQVEVLKGPQSLFYGKTSPGGVISIHTADPTDKFELSGSYGHEFQANENLAQIIISGPVNDSLKLRLATQYDAQDGYFKNNAVAAPGLGGLNPAYSHLPDESSYVIRGTAIWEPSEQFDAHLKIDLTNDIQKGGTASEWVSCPDGTGPIAPRNIPFLGGISCQKSNVADLVGLDPNAFHGLLDNSGVNFNEVNQKFGTLELNYRPRSDITLTSVTGFYRMVFTGQQNGSTSTDAGPGLVVIEEPLTRREVTEELRATSDFAGPVNFTAGAFYENGKLLNRSALPGNTDLGLPQFLSNSKAVVGIESASAFGQLRWKVLSKVEIDGGVRYTHEARDITAANLVAGTWVPFPTAVPKISSNDASPDVTVSYKPTADLDVFASYKTGFKSGSFNLAGLSGVDPNVAFGDEKVEGEEYGVKAQLLDRRLFTDFVFYDYHYKGLQVGVSAQPVNGVPVGKTLNAGGALIYGVDYDISYLPPQIDGLTLQGSVEWNRARFKTLNGVPCWGGQTVAEGCNQVLNQVTGLYTGQNLGGQPLLRAPDWQINFGFNYEMSVGRDMTLAFSNTNQYSSRYLTILGLRSDFYQPSFFKSDLTVALKGPHDRWEVAFIGKNVGDVLTTGSCSNSNGANGAVLGGEITGGTTRGPAGIDEVSCFLDRGREIWLRLTVKPFN